MRGLVILPNFSVADSNSLVVSNYGSEEDIVKHQLPYWDRLDLPDNPVTVPAFSDDFEYLRSEGIVQNTPVSPNKFGKKGSERIETALIE